MEERISLYCALHKRDAGLTRIEIPGCFSISGRVCKDNTIEMLLEFEGEAAQTIVDSIDLGSVYHIKGLCAMNHNMLIISKGTTRSKEGEFRASLTFIREEDLDKRRVKHV